MKLKIKVSTIARIVALTVTLVNECLVMFGANALPFTSNMAYQVISLVATIVVACVNAWYNNDITKVALLSGKVLQALTDGRITEKEIEEILSDVPETEKFDDGELK